VQLKSLFFGEDTAQALRIKRLLFALNAYFFSIVVVGLAVWQQLAPAVALTCIAAGTVAINVLFYLVIRSGLNRHLADPGMTIPQMALGTLLATLLIYLAPAARDAFLLGYVLILLFGIFRLKARATILVGAIAVVSYGAVIAAHAASGVLPNPAAEVLQLIMLAFLYPWFAQLGSHLNETRANLRETNNRLAQTLADYERALEQIRLQATHDELTGTYNRRHMMTALQGETRRAGCDGGHFSILVLDIDHFKHVNDRYGHPEGDRVLVEFATLVQEQLRGSDQLGRYGGEEFVVLLPDTGLIAAAAVGERIRSAVAAHAFAGLNEPLTVSIGAACLQPGETHDQTFLRADRALYRAKALGRNRVEVQDCAATASGAAAAVESPAASSRQAR